MRRLKPPIASPLDPPPHEPERTFVPERYTSLEGQQLEGQERWQLWRQDDHGTRFLMAEFDEQSEAEEEMQRMEARGHKQTYWVSRQ